MEPQIKPEDLADGNFAAALDGLTHGAEEGPKELDIHTPAAHGTFSFLLDRICPPIQRTHAYKVPPGVKHSWLQRFVPGIEKLAVSAHMGTYVAVGRGDNPKKVWESMPIYVRLGMQALYHGREQAKLLGSSKMEALLKQQTIKQGAAFDNPVAAFEHIQAFVKTYEIDCSELLHPNIADYETFNQFFYRALRPGARPIAAPEDEKVVSSAADCRLTVFDSVDKAKEIWIKGRNFNLANLLDDPTKAAQLENGSVAVFRLAPADYHRYHSPVKAQVGETKSIEGTYYTVNPCAVNEDLDVFTANRRDVTYLTTLTPTPTEVAIVQIGAMLVGSIVRTASPSSIVERGDELGFFAYGGSTVVAVFPPGKVEWDADLKRNSEERLETAVRVGEQIGRFL